MPVSTPLFSRRTRDRLLLVGLCTAAVAAGYLLRDDRPVRVAAALTDGWTLGKTAAARHQVLLSEYEVGRLSPESFAERIERETLPLWERAERQVDAARREGAKGETFENVAKYLRLRRSATEMLVLAIREADAGLLGEAKSRWAEAERLFVAITGSEPTRDQHAIVLGSAG